MDELSRQVLQNIAKDLDASSSPAILGRTLQGLYRRRSVEAALDWGAVSGDPFEWLLERILQWFTPTYRLTVRMECRGSLTLLLNRAWMRPHKCLGGEKIHAGSSDPAEFDRWLLKEGVESTLIVLFKEFGCTELIKVPSYTAFAATFPLQTEIAESPQRVLAAMEHLAGSLES